MERQTSSRTQREGAGGENSSHTVITRVGLQERYSTVQLSEGGFGLSRYRSSMTLTAVCGSSTVVITQRTRDWQTGAQGEDTYHRKFGFVCRWPCKNMSTSLTHASWLVERLLLRVIPNGRATFYLSTLKTNEICLWIEIWKYRSEFTGVMSLDETKYPHNVVCCSGNISRASNTKHKSCEMFYETCVGSTVQR